MKALGHNVLVLIDETEKEYKLDEKTSLIKAEVFRVQSRYGTVIDVGAKVEELKSGDRVYIRAQAIVGSDLIQDGVTYNVIDEAEVLVKL